MTPAFHGNYQEAVLELPSSQRLLLNHRIMSGRGSLTHQFKEVGRNLRTIRTSKSTFKYLLQLDFPVLLHEEVVVVLVWTMVLQAPAE